MHQFLSGAASMACLIVALFFIRFWRQTHDRLFIFFAGAFLIFMSERVVRASYTFDTEFVPFVYATRLVAFTLIIIAILDKNRRS